MATEQYLRELLAQLQERHPLKDGSPVSLLFGGWGFASTDLKDRSIVIPRSWLKDDPLCYFALIHEYAHLLSQDSANKTRKAVRSIHNFLAHDGLFKGTESRLMAEYGVRFRRALIYPVEIDTPWGKRSWLGDFTPMELVKQTATLNAWILFALLLVAGSLGWSYPTAPVYLVLFIFILDFIDLNASRVHQALVRSRYRRHGIRRRA